jgi:hypothetical protein
MCGGGKGVQQTSQQVAYPSLPAASAYSSAMDRISQATSQPFQKYSSDPNAYVAPLTSTQTGAIQNVTGLQGMTDPYYRTAGAMTLAGAAPVNRLTSGQIQEYMNPYMSQVVDPVQNALRQQFGMQQAQQQAQAIKSGAFGGERAGVERALLRGQQGLALGQALSPLYQTGYGQALQTAQGQQGIEAANLQRLLGAGAQAGGLGTAAQDAALKQASAQLQAGTLQQQTETAQKQALYNEFQKERMYPLQTAQLYAQAAGGLGPLMGSTSMGYQQMPFFGGFAADGGAIHGYDEGLGGARMGGAVDEAGDYSRGGYADGGYAYGGDAGFESIVAQHRAGIMPHMEDVAFPTADIRPAQQLEARLPESRASSGGLGSMLTKGAELGKLGLQVREARKAHPESWMDTLGAVATGKAAGGDVHSDAMQDLLSNPIQVSKPQQPQQAPQEQKGGLGGLLKAGAGLAANYFLPGSGALVSSGLGALGMADGGRAEYQEGGLTAEEADYYLRPLARIESGGRKDPYATVGPQTKYGRALGKYQVMEGNVPSWTKEALGRAMTRDEFLASKDAQEAVARNKFGEYLGKAGTPEGAAAMWFGGPGYEKHMGARDVLGTSIPQYQAMYKKGLGEADVNIPRGDPRREMMAMYPDRPTTEAPGPQAGLGSAQVKEKGFMERTQEHPESLILPVLQGLGAMAGSKNRYALGAIAEGLGAGAGSYMDMQAKQSEIDKRRQETATESEETRARNILGTKMGAETVGQNIQNLRNSLYTSEFGNFVFLRDGSVLPLDSYMSAVESGKQPELAGAVPQNAQMAITQYVTSPTTTTKAPGTTEPAPGTPPSDASKFTQPKVEEKLPIGVVYDDDSSRRAKEAARLIYAGGPASANARKDSEAYRADVTQQAMNARNNSPFIDELAGSLADVYSNTGAGMAGWKAGSRAKALSMANFLYRNLGGKEDLSSLPSNSEVVAKIQQLLAGQSASGMNQDSYAALSAIKDAIPNLEMSPDAGAKLMAELMVIRKKSMDREAHMNRWNRDARGNLQGAGQDFRDKHREAEYKKSQDIIAYIMKQDPATFKRLMSGSLTAQEIEDFIHSPKKPDGSGGFGAKAPDGISEFFPTVDRVQRTTAPGRP